MHMNYLLSTAVYQHALNQGSPLPPSSPDEPHFLDVNTEAWRSVTQGYSSSLLAATLLSQKSRYLWWHSSGLSLGLCHPNSQRAVTRCDD